MTNLKNFYDKLKDYTDKTLTTKELNELGISKYFINKLLEKGKLERVKLGFYLVKSLYKGKSRQQFIAYHYFQESVLKGNYDVAYQNLKRSFQNRINNDYDNELCVCFTLLKEILGNKYNFDVLKELKDLDLKKGREYVNWNNFCISVVSHDYESAKINLEKYAKKQLEKTGEMPKITIIMRTLLDKIISQKKSKSIFYEAIKYVNSLVENDKCEDAIQYSEKIIEGITEERIREKFNSLIELIKTVMAFRNDKKLVLNNENMANYSGNNASEFLRLYLRDKNYLKALDYIERACFEVPDSYNKLVKRLLFELKLLNIKNGKKNSKINEAESRAHFRKFLQIFDLNNLEESINELSLSVAGINLGYNSNVHNRSLLNMLNKLLKMRRDNETLEEKNVNYNLKDLPINNFNRAIDLGDYKKAVAFSHLVNLNNSVIFKIKEQVLSEMMRLDKINKADQKTKERTKIELEIKDLGDKAIKISIKQELTRNDIEELMNILHQKVELEDKIDKTFNRDESLLEITEITLLSLDGLLHENDFCKFQYKSSTDSEIFMEALNQGDYPTSHKILSSIDWNEFNGVYSFSFLRLAKKMLNVMISHLRVVEDNKLSKSKFAKGIIKKNMETKISGSVGQLMTPKERKEEFANFLHEICILIENCHYEEAYQKLVATDFSIDQLEEIYDILGNLAFIKGNLDHQGNELYEMYKSALAASDSKASEYLNEYKNFIVQNYMEESKYHQQKMLSLQKL